MMRRLQWLWGVVLVSLAPAQNTKPPQTFADSCWENRKAPSCKQWGFPEHSQAMERGFETRGRIPDRVNQPRSNNGVITNPHYHPTPSGMPARSGGTAAPSMILMSVPDWRFAHPNTGLLLSIKLQSILESPLSPFILGQIYSQLQAGGMSAEKLDQFRNALREIDQISVSLRPAGAGAPPDALILVTGRLDQMEKLLASRTRKLAAGGGLLMGAPNSVAAAIGRAGGAPAGAWSPLFAHVQELEQESDIWIAGPGALISTPEIRKALGADAMLLSSVKNFAVGLRMRDGVSVNLTLETTNSAAADQIVAAVRRLETGKGVEAAEALRVEKLDSGLRLRARAANDAGLARLSSAVGIPWNPAPGVSAAPGQPAKPKAIVIDGLDSGGPKELPRKP
jgi:hypothetical protein